TKRKVLLVCVRINDAASEERFATFSVAKDDCPFEVRFRASEIAYSHICAATVDVPVQESFVEINCFAEVSYRVDVVAEALVRNTAHDVCVAIATVDRDRFAQIIECMPVVAHQKV